MKTFSCGNSPTHSSVAFSAGLVVVEHQHDLVEPHEVGELILDRLSWRLWAPEGETDYGPVGASLPDREGVDSPSVTTIVLPSPNRC